MSSNAVVVQLNAKDNISGVIRGLKGNISAGIGDAVASVATLSAAIAASAIAFGSLGDGFNKAASLQTSQITSAYSLATVIGSTVSDAKLVTKDLTTQMIALGDTLPGVTEDYQKFASALGTTVAFGAKGDMNKYKKDLVETSKYGGLLAATGGTDATQGASAANKFLSGGMSVNEAFNTSDIFQRNQDFKTYLSAAQKQLNLDGKDFKTQLTTAQRTAVFNLAGSMKFTPEMIAAFGNTADTQLQAIKSKLFNPVTGIFGFAREVKGLDNRSALDAVSTFMGQISKLGDTAGKWLAANGINLDPMEAIGHLMDTASGWAAGINSAIGGDSSGLATMLDALKAGLFAAPQHIANAINTMLAGMTKGMKAVNPKQAGAFLSELLKDIGAAFMSIKIEDIAAAFNYGVAALSAAISGINWSDFGTKIGESINKLMAGIDWGSAEAMLSKALNAFFDSITGLLNKVLSDPINNALSKATGGMLGGDGKTPNGYRRGLNKIDSSVKPLENGLNDALGGLTGGFLGGDGKTPNGYQRMLKGGNAGNNLRASLPSLGQMSNSNSNSVFSPQINITGTTGDPKALADNIMTEFNKQYTNYRDSALT